MTHIYPQGQKHFFPANAKPIAFSRALRPFAKAVVLFCLCVAASSLALAQCEVFNNAEAANPLYAAMPVPQSITGIQFVDIDHDGDLDCYLVEGGNSPMIFYRNRGTAQRPRYVKSDSTGFKTAPVYPGKGAWAFADVDGDGEYEYLIGGSESGDRKTYYFIRIYKNKGTQLNPDYYDTGGRFLGLYNSSDITRGFLQFVFADIDGDGDKDFEYISKPGDVLTKNEIYLNAGSDAAPSYQSYTSPPQDISDVLGMSFRAYYDFDKDGLPDCVHTDGSSQYMYYRNIGTQQAPEFYWFLQDTLPQFNGVSPYLFTDVNTDGAPDVFNYNGQFATVAPVPVIEDSIVKRGSRSILKLTSANQREDYSYHWEYNGRKIPGYNKPLSYALKKGSYVLTIKDSCGEGVPLPYVVRDSVLIANADGINENRLSLEIPSVKIYPNPFAESVVVQISNQPANRKSIVTITDLAGRKLLTQTVSGTTVRIGSSLSKGMYLLQVWQNSELVYHAKLLKQ